MLYTVAEISEMLSFSKVTIYNKINLLKTDLNGCIQKKKGITYINDKGLLIIKQDLGLIIDEGPLKSAPESIPPNSSNHKGYTDFKEINLLIETLKETIETGQENYINSLLNQIELLKTELNKKDEQLNNTLRLLENSQILIRERNEKVLELESNEQKEVRKSFFDIFKKK